MLIPAGDFNLRCATLTPDPESQVPADPHQEVR